MKQYFKNVNLEKIGLKQWTFGPEEEQLKAVTQNGYNIEYVNNPSEVVQLEAVKQNGFTIKYIHKPSEAVQLEAIKQNGYVIRYIHNPTEAVQLLAVETLDILYVTITSEAAIQKFLDRFKMDDALS